MRATRRPGREIFWLGLVFVLFIAALLVFERVSQETVARDVPSTLNARGPGAKALFLLLQQERFPVERMETPWTSLGAATGLLVVIEPLRPDRPVTKEEISALKRWAMSGGSVLFLVTLPARPLDLRDPVAGDLAIVPGAATPSDVPPEGPGSPYTVGVEKVHSESPVRLVPGSKAPYETLFRDQSGAIAVAKPFGRGRVIVLANAVAAANSAIQQADNAVLLVNIATVAAQAGRRGIAFDEYHHGVGFDGSADGGEGGDSLLASVPRPMQMVLLHLCAVGALLLYVGNQRFGPLRPLRPPLYRASTDYVGSMAHLFRRANAGDIAIVTLYRRFVRDLRRQLDLDPGTPMPNLVQRAVKLYGVPEAPFVQFLSACEAIDSGERIGESRMLQLAQELDSYRRSFHLVGNE